jgi:putative FmdB family regulatory protein
MPIREYSCSDEHKACAHCRKGFEQLEKLDQPPVASCPKCGAPVSRRISAPSFARHASNFDDRAKKAGFHKLKRLGAGEYEKQY